MLATRTVSSSVVMTKLFLIIAVIVAEASASTCSQDGSTYSYTETVDDTTRTIVTNHCPNHPFYNNNPNYAVSAETTITIPAYPKLKGTAEDQTPTTGEGSAQADLASQGGSIGVLFDGGMLYSPFPGGAATTSFATSATYGEGNTFDQCGGHSSSTSSASYHYHVPPSCLMSQLGTTNDAHSPQIGWAADGFPVYGPRGPGGTMMQTCTFKGHTYDSTCSSCPPCTDDCGGMYKDDDTIDNFKYRYYMQGTYNDGTSCTSPACPSPGADYYPNSPMCYRGCCPSGVTCSYGNVVGSCASARADGFTSSYTASTTSSNGAAGAGTDMSSGLAINTGGCACGSLSCDAGLCYSQSASTESTFISQSWASNNCIGGTPNTCPATSAPTATATAAPDPTSAPTGTTTASVETVSQAVTFSDLASSDYTGTLKTGYEKGYGVAVGACISPCASFNTGISIASSATDRRAAIVTFVITLTGVSDTSAYTGGCSGTCTTTTLAAEIATATGTTVTVSTLATASVTTSAPTTSAPTTMTGNTATSAAISVFLGVVCTLLNLMIC